MIDSYSLPQLREAYNKHLRPSVLCPYGCSEFIHKCGYLSVDVVFKRHIQFVAIDMYSDREALSYVASCREDFLEFSDRQAARWLFNNDWKIMPSLCFIEGIPKIMTCRNHHKGSKHYHIHVCKQPTVRIHLKLEAVQVTSKVDLSFCFLHLMILRYFHRKHLLMHLSVYGQYLSAYERIFQEMRSSTNVLLSRVVSNRNVLFSRFWALK